MNRLQTGLLLGMTALGALSVVLLEAGHRTQSRDRDEVMVTLDNLSRARIHVDRAYLAAEGIRAGDPTFDAHHVAAELDGARTVLEDWRSGRSRVLGIEDRPDAGPQVHEAIDALQQRFERFRDEALRAPAPDPVLLRIAWSEFHAEATRAELDLHGWARDRRAATDDRHRRTVLAWAAFLLVAGGATLLLLRSRAAARGREAEAHRRRRSAEARYRALQWHAPVGLLRVDAAGGVMECNRWWNELSGTVQDGWTGRMWWEVLPSGEDRVHVAREWQERRATERPFSMETRYVQPDGSQRWLLSQWTPVRKPGVDGAGAPSGGWLGTVLDNTGHHELTRRLQQAQKLEAVGNLTAGIAHDFRNLLTVILGNLEVLRGCAKRTDELEALDDIALAADGGRELVARLMGFSRRGEIRIRAVDLGAVVQEALQLARRMLPPEVELRSHTAPDPGTLRVLGDPVAIQQIVLNLISNARDAMPDGGRITVGVEGVELGSDYIEDHPWLKPGFHGMIVVSDTGSGMDEATKERIFEPYFTTKSAGDGTGLGLATVHLLVRQHGGHVHVYSEPGQGTVFRIYLPASAERWEAGDGRDQATPAREPAGSRALAGSVLVVDDDAALRTTALRMLRRLGYDAIAEPDGASALGRLDERDDIALILSDVSMDGMSGPELLAALRRRGWTGRFVLTSGYARSEMEGLLAEVENASFLPKPWTLAELKALLDETGADAASPGTAS
jgi:PAS domain S-box-containing protein